MRRMGLVSAVGTVALAAILLASSPALAHKTMSTKTLDSTKPIVSARVRPNPCPSSPSVQPWVRGTATDNVALDGKWWKVEVKTLKGKPVGIGTRSDLSTWCLKRTATGYRFRFILWRIRSWNPASPYYYQPCLFRPGKYKVYVRLRDKAGNIGTARVSMRIT